MLEKIELAVNAGYRAYDEKVRCLSALNMYTERIIATKAVNEAKLAYCRRMMK